MRKNLHGQFVTIIFTKKDGTLRKANGKLVPPARENASVICIKETGVTMTDHVYTSIPLCSILEIHAGGKKITL